MPAQGLSHKAPIHRSSSAALGIPSGTTTNDLLYWDQTEDEWVILAAPATSGKFILLITDGTMAWQEVTATTATACVDGDEASIEVLTLPAA
jgi:hypothetical protein